MIATKCNFLRQAVGEHRQPCGFKQILPQINMPDTRHPDVLIVRMRHLSVKPIRSVTINGREWIDFDVQKEWLRIKNPDRNQYSILASY